MVRCLAENVTETTRGTVVNAGGVKCSTIEHGMAALLAAGIDNVWIEVDGPEFPILDGSAALYAREIEKVGVVEQEAERRPLIITEPVEVKDEKTGSWIRIEPSDRFEVNATIKFPGQVLGESSAEITDMSLFPKEMAAARTFVFVREIAPLLEMGLIKGGDLDSSSTRSNCLRRSSTPSACTLAPRSATPPNWVTSSTDPCSGTTSAPATRRWTSSATWPSSDAPFRAESRPTSPDTPSTTS